MFLVFFPFNLLFLIKVICSTKLCPSIKRLQFTMDTRELIVALGSIVILIEIVQGFLEKDDTSSPFLPSMLVVILLLCL